MSGAQGADPRTALGARVEEVLGGSVSELQVLPGGHSGLTYTVQVDGRVLVVKAVPPGRPAVGRHDVLRQARVLRALAGAPVPTPGVVAVDDREPAWFAMEWAPGEAVEPVLDGIPLAAGLARSRALTATGVLARLHAVAPDALAGERAATPADEVGRWARVLEHAPAEFQPVGRQLADALARHAPDPEPVALVHGDFRLGNVLFEQHTARAVVDWEIWGLGDPRVDLGYFGVFMDADNFPEIGTPVDELPDEDELLDAYAVARGRPVAGGAWFSALGRFRMAAIMAHNLRRHREGRYHDDAQETLPATIHRLVETGLARLGQAAERGSS